MPRIAVTLGTIALLAGSIGLNVVRYPAVWQMVADVPLAPPPGSSAATAPAANPAIALPTRSEAKRPVADSIKKGGPGRKVADDLSGTGSQELIALQTEKEVDADAQHTLDSQQTPVPPEFKSAAGNQPRQSGSAAAQHGRDKKGPASTASAQAAAKAKKKKDVSRPPENQWPAEVADARKAEVAQARQPAANTAAIPPTDQNGGDRPLVPVFDPGLASGSGPTALLETVVRRLPPVAPPPGGATARVIPAAYGGPLPPYPSTGIE